MSTAAPIADLLPPLTIEDGKRNRTDKKLRPFTLWPGIVVAGLVAAAAFSLHQLPGLAVLSPVILSVLVGMIFSNVVGIPENTKPGIAFSQRSLLRLAIVLLGCQVTASQFLSIGVAGIGIVALTLAATFCFTTLAGRALGIDRRLVELIAAGTSICGASAIVATNAVSRASDEDVAYAVACITLFGTIAMLTFPLLAPVLKLDQHHFGLWAGASIHEVGQVVGASFQLGAQAGETGTIAKLIRVALLIPVVVAVGLLASRKTTATAQPRPPLPWFLLAFLCRVVLNSIWEIPASLRSAVAVLTTLPLSAGLAAMGLHADIHQIRSRGFRPLLLALSASIFVSSFSLVLIKLLD